MCNKTFVIIFFTFITSFAIAQEKKFSFSAEGGINYTQYDIVYQSGNPPEIDGGVSYATHLKAAYALSPRWRMDFIGGLNTEKINFQSVRIIETEGGITKLIGEKHTDRLNVYADLGWGFAYQIPVGDQIKVAPFVRAGYMLGFKSAQAPNYDYLMPGLDVIFGKWYVSAAYRTSFNNIDVPYPQDFVSEGTSFGTYQYQPSQLRLSFGCNF